MSVHQHAIDQIKLHVSNDVKLQFFDANKPLYIEVDTSKKGIGAVMLQEDNTVQNESKSEILLFAVTHFKHFIYSRPVHIITDHKPLVSLFRKSLVDSSPSLTRMLVQLLDFTLDVTYLPGAQMHLSNPISRLSTHDQNEGKTIANLDVSIHAIEELTGFNSLSFDKIHQHATKDQTMKLLIQHINEGFPKSSTKLPDSIKAYFSLRDKLTVCNGIILKGQNRIAFQRV